jgi:sensor histidine kinase YesM
MKIKLLLLILLIEILPLGTKAENESLLLLLQSQRKDTTFVQLLDSLSFQVQKTSKDTALMLGEKAFQVSSETGYKRGAANASHTIAYIYLATSDYSKALTQTNKTLELAQALNDENLIARCLNNVGLIYRRINNFEMSASYYIKCLEFREKINDTKGIINTYNGLGTLFKRMNDVEKAFEYYRKGLAMARADSVLLMIAVFHQNIGLMFYENNMPDSATVNISEALKIFRQLDDEAQIAIALNNLGLVSRKKGDIEKAADYFNQSLGIADKRAFKESIIDASFNLAEIDFFRGRIAEALARFLELEKLAETQGNLYRLREITGKIQSVYATQNRFREAYDYSMRYRAVNDSIFNSETYSKIYDIQTKYEVDKKNLEIELLSKDKELSDARLKKTNTTLLLSVVLAFVLLGFLIAIYIGFLQKKRLNVKLLEQKKEIELQKYEISEQKEFIAEQHNKIEKELKETLVKSEVLKRENIQFQYEALKNQINPHFLFNSFSTLMNIIPDDPATAEKYVLELSNVYRYILTSSTADMQLLSNELEFIQSYMFLVNIRFDDNCQLITHVGKEDLDKKIPLLSLQLLVENAIKHNIINTKKKLSVIIETDGDWVAVRNNLQKRISVENSTGIGLNNIISRYKLVSDRNVEIIETGKEFIVRLPLLK